MIVSKLYRTIARYADKIGSCLRVLDIKLKYPNADINFKTYIGTNCTIICTDDSSLIIKDSHICSGTVILAKAGGKVRIDKTYIGHYSILVSIHEISINSNCEIAEMVVIRDQNHNYGDKGKHVAEQGFTSGPIRIKENVWIGCKATIFKDVEIGENSVIGASTLVNKNIRPNTVNVGIPSREIVQF
jgi:acetyltransferase-like isoleucine patch superfamily enzyme